jgi:alpha-glucosidase
MSRSQGLDTIQASGRSSSREQLDSSRVLSGGIEARSGKILLRVDALRDDLLRVRESAKGELPEDASWAVPAQVRHQTVEVIPEADADAVGFRTKTLRVRVERGTLRLSVSDLEGNVLQEDETGWPVEFHGNTYRV